MSADRSTAPAADDAAGYDLLTVDVWDTLLRRRCHPDSVKLHVSRVLLSSRGASLPAQNRDTWTLLRLRQQAEKDIGDQSKLAGLDDEYRHRDVYRRWLVLAGIAPDADAAGLLDALEQAELAQERHVTYVDPSIRTTLGGISARKVRFLSDFYFPAPAIGELLAAHGLDRLVPEGVVSCDVGLNKRSGRLFRHVHAALDVRPERHVHVGDNPVTDVSVARSLGIEAIHHVPQAEHAKRQQLEAGFHARDRFLRDATRNFHCPPQGAAAAAPEIHAFGVRCAPLFVGFVLDVMERACADGAQKIFFFTREGEFFGNLYRKLAELDVLGVTVPKPALLQVSRIATFAASLRRLAPDELMRIWNQYSVQSLQSLLVSLGLVAADFGEDAARLGLDIGEAIRYPWQDRRVLDFLNDPHVRERIERHLSTCRAGLTAYLESAGVRADAGKIHIVDIGWRGTIQDNLAHALPNVCFVGHYLGLNRYLNTQPDNTTKAAFGPNLNLDPALANLLDFVAPIEMLSNSPGGSVLGYRQNVGGVAVERHVDADENAVFDSCASHFQAGVLDAIPFWADFLRTHSYSSAELRPLAMETWSQIIDRPPDFLANAYFQLNHNETFGVGGFADKRERISTRDVLLGMVSRNRRRSLEERLAECGWITGLMASSGTRSAFRIALGSYLRIRAAKRRAAALVRGMVRKDGA